eukprot:2693461-Prymnesium_polylepis.1
MLRKLPNPGLAFSKGGFLRRDVVLYLTAQRPPPSREGELRDGQPSCVKVNGGARMGFCMLGFRHVVCGSFLVGRTAVGRSGASSGSVRASRTECVSRDSDGEVDARDVLDA